PLRVFLDLRLEADARDRWQLLQGALLVRQRVGLLEPHEGRDPARRQEALGGRCVRHLSELPIAGKRVFVRVDFNVPLDGGRVTDATRIEASLPTLRWILRDGGHPIVASHLGRPKGTRNEKYSLAPVAAKLRELLGCPVRFASDCVGSAVEAQAAQ